MSKAVDILKTVFSEEHDFWESKERDELERVINYLVINQIPELSPKELRRQRLSKKLSLTDVELYTGISVPHLSRIENGKIPKVGYTTIQTLHNLYNTHNE